MKTINTISIAVPHWDSQVEVPPFLWTATLTFNETPVICHHALIGTKNGNTITWRYLNDPSDPPTTWARSTSTSSRGSTGTPAPSSTVLSSGQPTSNPAMSSNGLSVGTGVGIGVGAVICLILILSLTVWLFLRKHRKGQVLGESLMHSSVPYKPELEVSNATAAKLQQPLPASEESARLESGHDLGIPEAPASQINELENIQRSELMG